MLCYWLLPLGVQISNWGGTPSKLSDTAANQRWNLVNTDGTVPAFNFINASGTQSTSPLAIMMNTSVDFILLDVSGVNLGTIWAWQVTGNPTLATVTNSVSIGSIKIDTTGGTMGFSVNNAVTTFTGIGATASQNGFNANTNDYSGLGVVNLME
ncbi:MAG: hypothetical protein RCG15_05575 [Candidatus Rickettsia vulgarisii]